MIADHLRIQPGQEALTPEQEAEARRFAQARIAAQLSTQPVDEPEAERFLQQAYETAGLAAPRSICWLDGPLQLLVVLASLSDATSIWDSMVESAFERVEDLLGEGIANSVWESVGDSVNTSVTNSVWYNAFASIRDSMEARARAGHGVAASVRAYDTAPYLACSRFFDEYLAPNEAHALAHFNERVSGYWLGEDLALLLRRPRRLARDAAGRLHNAGGKCLEYHDGWGFTPSRGCWCRNK